MIIKNNNIDIVFVIEKEMIVGHGHQVSTGQK